MGLYLPSKATRQPFPGIEVVNIGGNHTPESFREFAGTLIVPEHFSESGLVVPAMPAHSDGMVIEASRTQDTPRDPWAPDHHWHADRSYWGDNPFASVLYGRKLMGKVATTGFIDTTVLLGAVERDNPGVTEELSHTLAVFSVRRYYEEILPIKGSKEAIQKTLKKFQAATLEEVVDKECKRYPEKTFPAIATHPIRGEACLMGDDSRLVRFDGLSAIRNRELMGLIRDKYLNLPVGALLESGYYYEHSWDEGDVVIYPQIGTLHRAMPSPPEEIRRDTLRLFIQSKVS